MSKKIIIFIGFVFVLTTLVLAEKYVDIPETQWKSLGLKEKVIEAIRGEGYTFGKITKAQKSSSNYKFSVIVYKGKTSYLCDIGISVNGSGKANAISCSSGGGGSTHTQAHASFGH